MELHTLGVHGGYTQADVTALARVLTGWGVTDVPRDDGGGDYERRRWAFLARQADPAAARVIGLELNAAPELADRFDRPRRALEMLAAHPETARFLSTKLAEHYLGVPADAALVDILAAVFTRSGGDLARVAEGLAASDAFAAAGDTPRVAHPLGYAVRLARLTDYRDGGAVYWFTQRSGFAVFGRESPDGYPAEDAAYADSNAMLQRWQLAANLGWKLLATVPAALRQPPSGVGPGDLAWHRVLVEALAVRLTGRPLSDRSRAAVLEALATSEAKAGDRALLAATLVGQMPEASLR